MKEAQPDELQAAAGIPISDEVDRGVSDIVRRVIDEGDEGVLALRERHDGVSRDAPLWLDRSTLEKARDDVDEETRGVLERTAERIRRFAAAQRACLTDLDIAIDGGRAGHELAPVDAAGCYAPGGRYPLVSSVLMTAVTAKAAGVSRVVVATPSETPLMRAAAAIAGADEFLSCGGAHAIAALAHGTEQIDAVGVIVGPGNQWVTAAKQQVSARVGIDMLAGPSELVVVADENASAELVAADLLAQAEHDPDARVVLITTSRSLAEAVVTEAETQLQTLSTREVAAAAWRYAVWAHCPTEDDVAQLCNRLAPEHLHLQLTDGALARLRPMLRHFGALFVGAASAEVLGDYGAGPNHVLPTGGSARHRGGLSVLTFLRMRTWMRLDGDPALTSDACALAELEGLAAHGRAAARR